MGTGCRSIDGQPTDDELRALFSREREVFDSVRRRILDECGLVTVRRDGWTSRWFAGAIATAAVARANHIPSERAAAYLDDLARIGALAVNRDHDNRVSFWMHLGGRTSTKSIVWGTEKSIAWPSWSEADLRDQYEYVLDTDRGPGSPRGRRIALPPLDDEWHIELERY